MKKNEIKIFENEELGLQVRTFLNEDGSISVSAEDAAIGFGWVQEKKGKIYPRWETLNGYCNDLGFSQQVGKDDYIPESLFYMLGFKAGNERAQKYQQWLAIEVLPALRKTGSYKMSKSKPLTAVEQLQLQTQAILEVHEEVKAVNDDLQQFKLDMPILGIEIDRITSAVHRRGVNALGGKESNAYSDRSLRGKVYSDIYRELKRQFGVTTYKAIKRNQCDLAISVIDEYELPFVLKEQIKDCNAQMNMGGGIT